MIKIEFTEEDKKERNYERFNSLIKVNISFVEICLNFCLNFKWCNQIIFIELL